MQNHSWIFTAVLVFSTASMVFASVEPSFAVCNISVIVDSKAEWTDKISGVEQVRFFDTENTLENEISVLKPLTSLYEWQNNVIVYDNKKSALVTNSTKIEIIKEEITGENGIERTITACWKL